jgi:hypothetical protein
MKTYHNQGVKMDTVFAKLAGVGLFFVVIFVSGFWLSHSGKPYSALLFNIHKLIALGGIVFLGWAIYQARATALFDTLAILALIITGVCAITTIISGGLQNIEPPLAVQAALGAIHKVFPYLTLVSSAASVGLVFLRAPAIGG